VSALAATPFEFRNRFFVIGAIFGVGFACYRLDPVPLARSLAGALTHATGLVDPTASRLVVGAGAALVALGALLRSWAEAYLRSEVVHDRARHAEVLVADGPYRHVRNPLYLGLLLAAAGIGLLASRVGFFVLLALMLAFVHRLILHEEAGLRGTQGERFVCYVRAVPRLLPALRPRLAPAGAAPSWADGVMGETFLWSFAIGEAIVAATLDTRWFGPAAAVGFLIYGVQAAARRLRRRSTDG
jgi:protein-S-isoprenylcysteine O-methyltransferase Ste14